MIKKLLRKNLRHEFATLSPDIIRAVVWHITGGTSETFEQVYNDIIDASEETSPISQQLKDNFVYTVLLRVGRECCQDKALIKKFEETIRQIKLEVKIENQAKISNARLITKHSPLISDVESRKRKVDFEDVKDDSLRQGNSNL
ncbi:MAG: hypothetical protein WCR08_01200 [Gammaproteobacteria bacterium]|jgi:hypothetical protein